MSWKTFSLADLIRVEWVEGKRIELECSSYRHRQIIVCARGYPLKAMFSNGEGSYNAFWERELVSGDGSCNKVGMNVIPILPDGRVLMIIEQRGPLSMFAHDIPRQLELSNGKVINLREFGEHSSLEFPGGEIEEGEIVTISALRELSERAGVPDQKGILYRSLHMVFPYVCDLAQGNYIGAVYLSSSEFVEHVTNDGGLNVLALTPAEIELNIRNGVFCSINAGLYMWRWYSDAIAPGHCTYLHLNRSDLIIEEVMIKTS